MRQAHIIRENSEWKTPLMNALEKEDYRRLLVDNDIHVAGIENIMDAEGRRFTYDINTNTNFNPGAEAKAGKSGMGAIARLLQPELAATSSGAP